jgi:hypothetical protein
MILGITLVVIPVLLVAVSIFLFARRDDDALEQTWRRLMSPEARRLRQTVDARVDAQQKMISATRTWARTAQESGEAGHATRMEQEGQALAERLQHRDLLVVRRMLEALRPRRATRLQGERHGR